MKYATLPVLGAALLIACALATANPARADLTITSNVTVTGGVNKAFTQTAYFKADKARMESDTNITIYNCTSDEITTLDPVKKTYWTTTMAKMFDAMSSNPMMSRMKMDATADVTPTTNSDTILGKKAREIDYTLSMKMSMQGMDSSMMPTMKMSGQEWISDSFPFPTTCKRMADFLHRLPPMFGSGIQSLRDKMSAYPGYPLRNIVTIGSGGGPAGMGRGQSVVSTTEVTKISSATVLDSLFAIPAGYSQVDPPSMNPSRRGGM